MWVWRHHLGQRKPDLTVMVREGDHHGAKLAFQERETVKPDAGMTKPEQGCQPRAEPNL